jgi:signal transduction histidine kinase/CheY-like chemotaxis protein/HPt (histidine-containing phosphotransfer) domain-containing protein
MTPTPKTTIENLFAGLDLAVFERLANGWFQALGATPAWLSMPAGPVDLADLFPMLEIFLPECEAGWENNASPSVQSDIWTEPDPSGGENYLQAVAAAAGGRRFVVLRRLPQALFTYQQLAHDVELANVKIERLSRELELKRREAERATQAKSDFLAAMSHEIRTPLNSIIGMADVLSQTRLTVDQQKYVEIFQRNGVALLNLINDILDLSKVEAGHVELEATEVDAGEVVMRAMEVVEVRAKAKGLWLRHSIAEGLPRYFVGDPNRLRQVIINLLGNSIKFTESGGLQVTVEQDPESSVPGHLRFAITDTGIGIPSEKLGLIFESFTQVDASTTRKYGGTGLGLTISKQLVELMNGRIWVESELGSGSTFFFTAQLGVHEDQSPRAAVERPAAVSTAELEARASGLRILLVDDSDDNRVLIIQYLGKTNARIDTAENGKIAVERFRKNDYDVVLMDVEMPVMDGYQAVREIRRIEQETGAVATPVLALTAHAFAEMAMKGFEAGFTELLTKPIRQAALLAALAKYGTAPVSLVTESIVPEPELPHSSLRVRVEEGMEDVVPGYLEKRRAEVPLYREALSAADFPTISRLAHKMKGTGTGYGFERLTELGATLETAARAGDAASVTKALDEFALYVTTVELEYPNAAG